MTPILIASGAQIDHPWSSLRTRFGPLLGRAPDAASLAGAQEMAQSPRRDEVEGHLWALHPDLRALRGSGGEAKRLPHGHDGVHWDASCFLFCFGGGVGFCCIVALVERHCFGGNRGGEK